MRLLVIEDEERIAKAIKNVLEIHHFAVDLVFDSDSGLSSALDPDYDLIILDRKLPGSMEGLELCRKIREATVQTPILMLTALGEIDDRVAGLKSGADDYLTKPFAMAELIARVSALLRRPAQTLGPIIKIADLEVNIESYEVKRAGRPVKLSMREFKLLAYLLHHQGQTLTKDTIISHVWDGDTIIMPNTVEVYLGYLRRKIDKAFPDKKPLIQTVHGFGYRLGDTK